MSVDEIHRNLRAVLKKYIFGWFVGRNGELN